MNTQYEVVELYREIGREFRQLGAEKVILLHSRTNPEKVEEMILEIAVEGFVEKEKLNVKSKERWPFLTIEIILVNELNNHELENEIMEDGIII